MSTENPLVSVVIPYFNAESFIRETVESDFSQTYDESELLIVDDGSSDSSTEVALKYEIENPGKVRYLEHDEHLNIGLPASSNSGLRNSKGKYIVLLDADGVWVEKSPRSGVQDHCACSFEYNVMKRHCTQNRRV